MLDEYDAIVAEHGPRVVDATRSITEQQRQLRELAWSARWRLMRPGTRDTTRPVSRRRSSR
ncbi:MAG TPA: hypothetical protein VHD57_08600 [Vicinamibacterales bacterium]|nr:hypothetical protein [Vicinamibacterales bacterium]